MKRESAALSVVMLSVGLLLAVILAFALEAPQRLVAVVSAGGAAHRLDGHAHVGEYQFRWLDQASRLSFEWSIESDRLIGAVSSPDTGWVAAGIGGEGPLMYGADIVIGYVDARGAHLRDHFGNTPTSHEPDTALGGRNDVLAAAGLQTAEGTMIEFERPLAAHDTTDRSVEAGQTHVITASSESDDLTAYHFGGRKAVSLIDLFVGPSTAAARRPFIPDHLTDVQIMLATWMTLMLMVGVHGLAAHWAAGTGGAAEEGTGSGSDVPVVLIGVATVVELAALGVFAIGVAVAAPTWLLGSTLALGLLALAGIIVLYGRAFVRWDVVRGEREDGIPW